MDEHRVHDGKDFCCNGCKVVYDLLNEAGLCDYYALEEKPGVKQRSAIDEQRTELFELPEVRELIVEFSEEGITRARFHVPQIHCSSCIWLLENLNRIEPNILRSRVSFTNKELTINFRETGLPLPKLVALLRRIGYGPQLTASSGTDQQAIVPRMLYIRLGVAGFIFGNTMLLSFPEYFGADTEAGLKTGFQWLIVLFSLPVVFFLSTDFFSSAWAGIRSRQVNIDQPIALGIVALWSRSLWEVIAGVGPGYFDSLAGLLFFLLVGRWYQAYTYRALRFDRALEDFLPLLVLRKTADGEVPVRVADLAPGDRIVIRDQELVPVDAMLLEGTGHIDNSFITGESLPSRKHIGDTIKAGGRQRGAAIELEVLRTFNDSRLKKLWAEQSSLQDRPAMPKLIDTVARRFTVGVLLVAVGAGLFWWGKDPAQVWLVVTAVLIVACPCALALSMPFAYGHTIRLMGKRGLFLRDTEVVERMAHADTVVFDKTGTLTAREAYDVGFRLSVVGSGRSDDTPVGAQDLAPVLHDHATTAPSSEDRILIKSLARNSTHPLSAVLFKEIKGEVANATDVEEHAGQGIAGSVNGVPVRIGSATFCGGEEQARGNGDAHVHITLGGVHRGHYVIRKRARSGIVNAVHVLRRNMRVALLTGDASVDAELTQAFANATVRTHCSPVDKGQAIIAEQQNGHRVVMVGDGLNDAGALAQSDVGITVTETTAALTPASDAIMDAHALEQLPYFLLMARRARRIVIASLIISLCYNITGIAFAVSGQLTPLFAAILMPLSSVTVVAFVSVAVWSGARR